jgi:hypothetical protein
VRVAGLTAPITYWPPAVENQYAVRSYSAPVLIHGRWEDHFEELATLGGKALNSKAIVYPDRDLQVNGFLAQGDHTNDNDPTIVPGAAEILAYFEDPDLRSCTKVRKAVL